MDEKGLTRVERNKDQDADFDYKLNNRYVFKFEDIGNKKFGKMLDSRFTQVFDKGHVPESISIPFTDLLNEDRSFKTSDELS